MKHRILASRFLRCAAFLLALLAVGPAGAATFYVDSGGDRSDANLRDGECIATDGRCTLRAAVEQSNALIGKHVIYLETATYSLKRPLTIGTTISISGVGTDKSIVYCGFSSAAFQTKVGSRLYLGGLSVERCLSSENRGLLQLSRSMMKQNIAPAIRNFGELEVLGSTLLENFSGSGTASGGAIANESGGSVAILESVLEENSSDANGGAISNAGRVIVGASRFIKNNAAIKGGAIYNTGTIDLQEVTFDGNSAYEGGALYSQSPGQVWSWESSFINNRAQLSGGAIVSNSSYVDLISSTVSGNRALEGGGLYALGEPNHLWLANATVTNNTAAPADGTTSGAGGGLYGTAMLSNTILAGNTTNGRGQDCFSAATDPVSRDHNIIGILDFCGLSLQGRDQAGDERNPFDPKLLPLNQMTRYPPFHAPDAESPAIDRGNPDGCRRRDEKLINNDQLTVPRHLGEACDAGAIEVRQ